ncbi:hypothetical protein CFP65_7351 [Kitasatospora sp. MMS16-BH015]|uniref:hypothetical protein n=1 Tax=Kitasatospora sp. MMS16-BH015 TaxID=2018025 RepID=UPI000CA2D64D|nr:hypothetical protein [Kitasatospora sp. MMS16-BH015]AUG81935.1 hypothetical protein CFP65_7351 [Kitasatospora sp. MMS16-BH015]
MRNNKLVAGALASALAAGAVVGVTGGPASAEALPKQAVAAKTSLASATVLDNGAKPQFFHAIVSEATKAAAVVNAAAATAKATAKVVKVTSKFVKSSSESSSSSSESSSSSSGGPVTAVPSLHGVIAGDAQFDY